MHKSVLAAGDFVRVVKVITVACTFLAGDVVAGNKSINVSVHVSNQGLDLSTPADARTFYARLRRAAGEVCTHGNRVGLVPLSHPESCAEQALADAIRSAEVPLLTQIYSTTHTLQEAAARGIDVPAQVVALKPTSERQSGPR